MIRGVKTLKAAANPQTTFLCLSSANTVFISTILEVSCGRLSIRRFQLIHDKSRKVERTAGPVHGDSDQSCRVGRVWPA